MWNQKKGRKNWRQRERTRGEGRKKREHNILEKSGLGVLLCPPPSSVRTQRKKTWPRGCSRGLLWSVAGPGLLGVTGRASSELKWEIEIEKERMISHLMSYRYSSSFLAWPLKTITTPKSPLQLLGSQLLTKELRDPLPSLCLLYTFPSPRD